ncbi:reticulon-3-B-like [Pholidichthys leucotaenia]
MAYAFCMVEMDNVTLPLLLDTTAVKSMLNWAMVKKFVPNHMIGKNPMMLYGYGSYRISNVGTITLMVCYASRIVTDFVFQPPPTLLPPSRSRSDQNQRRKHGRLFIIISIIIQQLFIIAERHHTHRLPGDSSVKEASSNWCLLCSSLFSASQLVHWREPKKSAAAFGLSLLVLVSVATLSVISVVSYLLLAVLCITITFRVYKSVIQAVQKSDQGHPFRPLLERDISVSSETVRQLADQSLVHLNWFTAQTRRLLLVEDLVDSLKLAAVMWVMTYVGAIFNGVTILILADIIFFTTPLLYQRKKAQIDRAIDSLRSRMEDSLQRLQDRLPGAVKRTKAE